MEQQKNKNDKVKQKIVKLKKKMSIEKQQDLVKFLNRSLSGKRYFQVRQAIINDKECNLKFNFGRFLALTYVLSDNQIKRIWQIIDETYEQPL